MKILCVSQYFPPEMGAPAARAAELAHHWSQAGHEVSVLTGSSEELKVARDYEQVRRILLAAFGSNDFDGFELNVALLPGEIVAVESLDAPAGRRSSHSFHWHKPGRANRLDNSSAWTIALDLLAPLIAAVEP